jgi:hypothetical protein
LLNASLFVLVGLQLRGVINRIDVHSAWSFAAWAAAAVGVVILTRIAWVFTITVVRDLDLEESRLEIQGVTGSPAAGDAGAVALTQWLHRKVRPAYSKSLFKEVEPDLPAQRVRRRVGERRKRVNAIETRFVAGAGDQQAQGGGGERSIGPPSSRITAGSVSSASVSAKSASSYAASSTSAEVNA